MLFWYPLFTSCECKADSRSVAAVCLTALAFWVTDSSVALLLSLFCSLRERERERQVRESSNIDCFVVSVLGTGLRLFKTELVQKDTVSPSQMKRYGSLYKDCQVFSLTHWKTFSVHCTLRSWFCSFIYLCCFAIKNKNILEPYARREPLGYKTFYSLVH